MKIPAYERMISFEKHEQELAALLLQRNALLEALQELDNAVNEPSLGIDIIKASDKARSAIALAQGGNK